MIDSRKLEDLHPRVEAMAREFIKKCEEQEIKLLVTSTYRDAECQTALYAKGRTAKGPKVTNAKAGQSYHNWRVALDVVPMVHGKPVWKTTGEALTLWQKVGKIGKSVGFEWAGDWKTFKEFPHFQFTDGLKIKDFQAGKTIKS